MLNGSRWLTTVCPWAIQAYPIAVFQFVYPAVAIVIDWACFDQQLGSVQLFGIALMSVAIGYVERPSIRLDE